MFEHVFNNVNFNYQVNRVLSFHPTGCDRQEVLEAMENVTQTEEWYQAWLQIAQIAENESRYLHSMYYYRMAEFFLLPEQAEKEEIYLKIKEMFARYYPNVKKKKFLINKVICPVFEF